MKMLSQLLNVSSADPDDARRRKLLNILLVGVGLLTLVALVFTTIGSIVAPNQVRPTLYLASIGMLIAVGIIFLVNRYGAGWVAGALFIVILTGIVALAEEPRETITGRSLVVYAIPIFMASIIIRPYASFIAALLISIMMSVIGIYIQVVPNIMGMIAFFVIALVTWIAARNLEQALSEVRQINRELDQRVIQRTQELAQSLSQNQAILNSIADGVIVFDHNGQAIIANPSISHLLNRPAAEIITRDLETLMGQDVTVQDRKVMDSLLQGDSKDYPAFKVAWGTKTLSVSCAPVRVESASPTGAVAVFRDFTREAELERMKSAFVSTVSHELRTPLNAILGYADMLSEGVYGDLNDRQHEVMQRLMANTNRQLSLVNDLLDRAQIEAGTLSLNYTQIRPTDLLHDMHATMIVLAGGKGLELNCHIADDVPETLQGDSQRLHQILINLANNAIKFTEQGHVDVNILRADEAHWAIKVSDTGPGIADEAQEFIFEPFRTVDSSATRKHRGAGLGLSIVKQLANLMGGDVTVASQIDHGSTFTVTLPLIPSAPTKEK